MPWLSLFGNCGELSRQSSGRPSKSDQGRRLQSRKFRSGCLRRYARLLPSLPMPHCYQMLGESGRAFKRPCGICLQTCGTWRNDASFPDVWSAAYFRIELPRERSQGPLRSFRCFCSFVGSFKNARFLLPTSQAFRRAERPIIPGTRSRVANPLPIMSPLMGFCCRQCH